MDKPSLRAQSQNLRSARSTGACQNYGEIIYAPVGEAQQHIGATCSMDR